MGAVPLRNSIAPDQPMLAGLRVVIVEDDSDLREVMALLLESQGASVTVAPSAADAVAAVETERPDVLVSDIGLPQADGYDLIGRVRALPPGRGGTTPAIALTGYSDRGRALAAGYQAHLAKPVEVARLLATIAELAAAGARRPS